MVQPKSLRMWLVGNNLALCHKPVSLLGNDHTRAHTPPRNNQVHILQEHNVHIVVTCLHNGFYMIATEHQ